jgi:hypothetical protein
MIFLPVLIGSMRGWVLSLPEGVASNFMQSGISRYGFKTAKILGDDVLRNLRIRGQRSANTYE